MVLLTPDVSNGKESAPLKFSRLILSGVASIMCSASVIMFTCFIGEMVVKRSKLQGRDGLFY